MPTVGHRRFIAEIVILRVQTVTRGDPLMGLLWDHLHALMRQVGGHHYLNTSLDKPPSRNPQCEMEDRYVR